jgi:hypothetical protein
MPEEERREILSPPERAVLQKEEGGRGGRGGGATCAAEVKAVAVHGDGSGGEKASRGGAPRERVWRRLLPRAPARGRWQSGAGTVTCRWDRRRSRTNGWERVPSPSVAAARSAPGVLFFFWKSSLFFFLCENVRGRLVKKFIRKVEEL